MKKNSSRLKSILFLVIIFAFGIGYYQMRMQKKIFRQKKLNINSQQIIKTKELPDTFNFCGDSLSKSICNYLSSKYQVDLSPNEGVYTSGNKIIFSLSKINLYKMKRIRPEKIRSINVNIVLQSIIIDKKIFEILEEYSKDFKIELYAIRVQRNISIKNIAFVEIPFSKIKNLNIDKAHQIFSQVFEFNYKVNYKKEISPLFN